MSEQKQIHVAIVGGGIGGVLLGIALSKFQHITYTIFESRGAFGEIGAGVAFFKNGHTAMRLIDPRIWESYLEIASFNGWDDKQGVWFDFVRGERGEAEGRRIIEVQLDDPRGLSQVHRASLLDALVRLLPAGVTKFNRRLVSVDQGGENAVCHFADGSRREADLVVGCDGIWSACRPLVIDDPELASPRFTRKVAYRGLVPMEAAEEVLGREHANNRTMYLGRGGHVLTFPVASGTLMNAVAFHESEKDSWEGDSVQKLQMEKARRDFSESLWGSYVVNIVKMFGPYLSTRR
ncbi:hypothetical protein KVR01_003398 [Diaporthe batatas]|uniref:uncharacterized protein n=1 Tax=Diaporthe batatas TaxID=748121 RepID=UPI001D04289B|nr:uncharacterized protein KVR01_003398 [Diaporthe batatas]KAG8167709.1 hypothetical protein KVR01_003398 [Diaporthe batatas]